MVHRVVHNGGGQSVETQEIGHLSIVLEDANIQVSSGTEVHILWTTSCCLYIYLHQVSVNNILPRQQPVFHLFLVHGGHKVELAQVIPEEPMHHRHVFLGHLPQTRSLWSLREKKMRDKANLGESCRVSINGAVLSLTSGRRYNFMVRCIVMFLLKWENLTSISLRGFSERCQYLRREGPSVKLSPTSVAISTPPYPPACAHRFGQDHPSGVDRLEDSLQVYPSCDFSYQNRSNSFRAKLLVDAEEIDLNHFLFSEHQNKANYF